MIVVQFEGMSGFLGFVMNESGDSHPTYNGTLSEAIVFQAVEEATEIVLYYREKFPKVKNLGVAYRKVNECPHCNAYTFGDKCLPACRPIGQ